MTRRAGTASLVASPVLVGTVTVLIVLIAIFITFNANKGLPFVPTYDLNAELPNGAKLVKGNEVRVGGFRVGIVDDLKPKTIMQGGRPRTIAVVKLKLDKTIQPLARDSRVRVRPRSALGLKYVELSPGRAKRTYTAGDTMPLRYASLPLEFEDIFRIYDRTTRPAVKRATEGFGDAFAGRGQSINITIQELRPLFRYLSPVMRNLSNPRTRLDNYFRQLGRAAAQAAPVAHTQAVLFTNMADTFEHGFNPCPRCLQDTIHKTPPNLDANIRSLPVQGRFYHDFAITSRELRPAARAAIRYLPGINRALAIGTPIQRRQPELNGRIEGLNNSIRKLFENPSTLLSLKDLHQTLRVARPLLEFVAPYQTVCNYWNYWWMGVGEHQSHPSIDKQGLVQNIGAKSGNDNQANSDSGSITAARRHDIPPNEDPLTAVDASGTPLARPYDWPYEPAIDAQGNADCQTGQRGYMRGPLRNGHERYGPGLLSDGTPSGGNWPVTRPNQPGLTGGTYVTRQLGITNLRDVP
jgi:ABC-type transporter Mla subunit MlaD